METVVSHQAQVLKVQTVDGENSEPNARAKGNALREQLRNDTDVFQAEPVDHNSPLPTNFCETTSNGPSQITNRLSIAEVR